MFEAVDAEERNFKITSPNTDGFRWRYKRNQDGTGVDVYGNGRILNVAEWVFDLTYNPQYNGYTGMLQIIPATRITKRSRRRTTRPALTRALSYGRNWSTGSNKTNSSLYRRTMRARSQMTMGKNQVTPRRTTAMMTMMSPIPR